MYSKIVVPSILFLSVNGAAALSFKRDVEFAGVKRDVFRNTVAAKRDAPYFVDPWQSVGNQAAAYGQQEGEYWWGQIPSSVLPSVYAVETDVQNDIQNIQAQIQAWKSAVQASPLSLATPTPPAVAAPSAAPTPLASPPAGSPSVGSPSVGLPPAGSSPMGSPPVGLLPAVWPTAISPSAVPSAGSPTAGSPSAGLPTTASPTASSPIATSSPSTQQRRRSNGLASSFSLPEFNDLTTRELERELFAREIADEVFGDLSSFGDDFADLLESLIGDLPAGASSTASQLLAEVTAAVSSEFDKLESGIESIASSTPTASTATSSTPTPSTATSSAPTSSATPSGTVVRRQATPTSTQTNTILGEVDDFGDEFAMFLNALLGELPSNLQPAASSLLSEATAAVGGAFATFSQGVEAAASTAYVAPTASVSPVASSAGALVARSTHSANAARGTRASALSAAGMGLVAAFGSMFFGAFLVL